MKRYNILIKRRTFFPSVAAALRSIEREKEKNKTRRTFNSEHLFLSGRAVSLINNFRELHF